MAQDTALQKRIQRIGAIVEQLESAADPKTRTLAKELLESIMALHGAGLERILEIAGDSGDAGRAIIQKCGSDDLVSSLLLLYSLHPEDLPTRVNRALENLQGYLNKYSAKAEIVSIREDGSVILRLDVQSTGCGSSAASVKSTLESAIQDAAPDAPFVIVEETGAALKASGFVSLAQLQSGQDFAASVAARAHRSGD
jgi:Fe-S cluster biogenesis protein NfuA